MAANGRLVFRGARLIDPASGTDATFDVAVWGGLVREVGMNLTIPGARVVDASGAVLAPGLVDLHVHLREPGREDEETVASGSAAAAIGGFTAVCAMPNTEPVCDSAAVAEMVAAAGAAAGLAEVVPAGALTRGQEGKSLAAIGEMAKSHARVRFFTDDGRGVQDARVMRRAMEYVKGVGGVCAEHCEDSSLSAGGQMNEGGVSSALGLKGIPAEAEEIALARDLALARLTGARFHAQHVSTAGAVELIAAAKRQGLPVTAEATPHHAVLTDDELSSFDPRFKVNPPLRTAADVEAIRDGLASGVIDAIATDHAPHAAEEKEAEFEAAPPGTLGLETALGAVIAEMGERLGLVRVIELMSSTPARILGLKGQGGPVAPGMPANLVIFDPACEWIAEPSGFSSLSRNSVWTGRRMKGKVLWTCFRGRLTAGAL